MTREELNKALCDLLGVNWRDSPVASVTLHLAAGKYPRVIVERQLFTGTPASDAIQRTTQRYQLCAVAEPAPAPAPCPARFDLDALVARAQLGLAVHVGLMAVRDSRAFAEAVRQTKVAAQLRRADIFRSTQMYASMKSAVEGCAS